MHTYTVTFKTTSSDTPIILQVESMSAVLASRVAHQRATEETNIGEVLEMTCVRQ